ncbi:MAG: PAS domain-containing sensor histidine kinase [Candidatus Methanoperedens sp.]|nr:PAS domain-containing sensor histidine kinase [Candidatus Methanoperedens sp.]
MGNKNGKSDIKYKKKLVQGEPKLSDMESIFASIQDGIGVIDKDMNIILVNPIAHKWYPETSSFIGKKCFKAFHGRSEPCEICPSLRTLKTGKSTFDIVPKHGKEGEKVGWIEINSFPWIDTSTGEMKGVIEHVHDITERKKTEERYKLFSEAVEEAPDGVQIVDLNGHITYSNRAVEEIFGIPNEELLGKHVNEMNVDPEFAGKVILPSIIETGRWVGELMVKHKGGYEFPIWLNTSIVKDSEGNPIAMVGIIRDMTERRRFEKALKESEEQYRSLFEDSPVSLWEEDISQVKKYVDNLRNKGVEDLRIYFESHPEEVERCAKMVKVVNVNKATLSLFRAQNKEELLNGLHKIFTEHSFDVFREELVAIADGRTWFEGEDFVRTMTGNVLNIFLKWSVAPGYEKTYSRRIVSIIDITERKRIEESIKKYTRKLEESNRMKELFIDIMHHDLMNPLATASGFTELLKDYKECNMMYVETIEKNLLKAMDLIECATRFSRIDSIERIELTDLDLSGVINEVIENLRPSAERAGMEIENTITVRMPVKANRIIEEVFSNLISNAIKYAQNGKRIIVKAEDKDPFWNVMIIDFGEGLRQIDKTVIFDRFCRLDKKGVKGSGLGLAIAKKIVELHKGGIGVEDNPQGGAVFIVEIPKSEYLDQVH